MATDPLGALPPEYQNDLDAAQMRRQLAQMLQQQGMNIQAPQQQGRIAAKISPFAALGSIAQSGIGAYLGNKAQHDIQDVRTRFNTDQNANITQMQNLPEDQAVKFGQTSQFPMTRELAKTMQTQAEKRRELTSTAYNSAGDLTGSLAALRGTTPPPTPAPEPPSMRFVPDPSDPSGIRQIPMIVNKGKYGIQTGTSAGSSNNTSINLPGKEGELAISQIGKNLDDRRKQAQTAQGTLYSTSNAIDALEKGALVGGGQDWKQGARKVGQAFGVDLPETAPTEQLKEALLKGVLEHAKELYPVSNTDMKTLREMVGSIDSDPTALTRILAFGHASALRTLNGYNDYVGENQKNIHPLVQGLFSGATSGYELPKSLFGPTGYQLEVVRQLQRQGFPINKLADPSGQPFAPDAKFGGIDPTQGFPGIQKTNPGNTPVPAQAPNSKGTAENPMTYEEYQQFLKAKK